MNVRCLPTIARERSPEPAAMALTAMGDLAPARSAGGRASELLLRVLEGERTAERRLVEELTPTIRASVSRELALRRRRSGRATEQEVEDITQSVLLGLFADGGRTLKKWDPARGRELKSFVGLLAQRRTVTILRCRRTSPWSEDPMLPEDLDKNPVEANGPESRAISRDMLGALLGAVRARLTARGAEIFRLLFLEGASTEDVCTQTDLSAASVYQWRRRLRLLVEEVAGELKQAPPPLAH